MEYERVRILGIPFIQITLQEMVDVIESRIVQNEKTFLVTANPEIVMQALEDDVYRKILHKAHYITADGIGVVKAATLLGSHLPERVTGFDLFISLLERSNARRYSIYLLGAEDAVLQKAKKTIETTYPHCTIVGSHHGFFNWDDRFIENEIK